MAVQSEDFRRFTIDLDGFKGITEEKANQLKRLVAFQILDGVIKRTPVDTGRARGNWQVGINAPPGGIRRTDKAGLTEPGEGGHTLLRGSKIIAEARPGDDVWISNNLPYIGVLEEGRIGNKGSKQAPVGMLALTLAEVGSQFR